VVKFIVTGSFIGLAGVLLSFYGNPANTGFCVSCFMENIAGSLGLHGNVRMQYIRPEIIGFVLGSFLISVYKKDFKSTSHGSPLLRFFVGILLIVGSSVFIGCPVKMVYRISAGDLTALSGLAGLCVGVYIGMKFLDGGFRIGRAAESPTANGYLVPGLMFLLLIFLILKPPFISFSTKGSGAQYAPMYLSLAAGLIIGALAQRSGFCITGGIARIFLWGPREVKGCPKSTGLLMGIVSFFIVAFFASLLTGQFSLGWHGQPSSNVDYEWAFIGMVIVGFGSVLIKGCPLRQLVVAGQGDSDAGAAVLGMLTGAALVQNWGLGGNATGTPYEAKMAVIIGLGILFVIGIIYRDRSSGIAPEYQTGLE
jgi:YedE family putative selenium metabolism protein